MNFCPYQPWVEPYAGDNGDTSFTVDSIEVVTSLDWDKPFKAMVNITLAKKKAEKRKRKRTVTESQTVTKYKRTLQSIF